MYGKSQALTRAPGFCVKSECKSAALRSYCPVPARYGHGLQKNEPPKMFYLLVREDFFLYYQKK
jgi:hypothetical protein